MLQKFVGEENEEENGDNLEDINQKLNILKEKKNKYQNNENDNIFKEEDITDLIEKINNLDSDNINVRTDNNNITENNNCDNNGEKIIESENKIYETKNIEDSLLKLILQKDNKIKLLYLKLWNKNIKEININDNEKEEKNEEEKEEKNEEERKEEQKNENEEINHIEETNNNQEDYKEDNKENKENNNDLNNDDGQKKINDLLVNNILKNDEEDFDDHSSNDIIIQHQNRLLSGETNNFQILNPLTQIGDLNINLDNIFSPNKNLADLKNNNLNSNEVNKDVKQYKNLICLSIYNIAQNKIYNYKKILFSYLKHKSIISDYHDKLYQLDKLNKKYEAILDEKSSIIINKTDENEELKETIEKLTKNLKEANKKNKSLNVIQESLCAKCGGTLEESFTGEVLAENQNIIKEQNQIIEMMKKEMSELRSKYNLSEIKLKDLDNIKKEFENLSGSLLKPRTNSEAQTDESLLVTKQSSSNLKNENNNNNINIQINNINSNKKGSKKKNIPKKPGINFSNSTNNYMSTSLGHNKNNNNTSDSITNNEINNEVVSSLRFDNSVLSNELLNLNREFNKLRSEFKIVNDKNIKYEKDKKDLSDKLKSKTELCDKYKKENEEINRLINNSKYKNIVNAETENKKLKNILQQNDIDIKKLKNMNEKCAKKIIDQNAHIEKMKNALASFLNFKQQKETLTIENQKYENEIKELKIQLEEEKNINEKNSILMNNKDKEIEKLSNEVSYYSFHIKKCKSDAERALEDAIGYQKIVRILEVQLNDYEEQLNKIKQDKNENE